MIFLSVRFYVKSIFGILEIHNLVVLHFAFLRIFALCEDWNLPNWQISKPLKLYKKGSFTYNFYILQNWFHVISESWNFLTVSVRENFRNFHNVMYHSHSVEKREIHCHANFFPSNQFIVKFFSKTLFQRNFGSKIAKISQVRV